MNESELKMIAGLRAELLRLDNALKELGGEVLRLDNALKELGGKVGAGKGYSSRPLKERAAARRASMDVTRALAKFRRWPQE